METSYRKNNNGVVINTNKSGLINARRRKKILLVKEQRIDELEERLFKMEELLSSVLNKQ